MNYGFRIVTDSEIDNLLIKLEERLKWIKQKDFSFQVQSSYKMEHSTYIVDIYLEGNKRDKLFRDEDIIHIFKHQIAEVLAEHIVYEWESKLLWKAINRKYRSALREDKTIIHNKASEFLCKCHYNESLNLLMAYGRKNRIAHRLFDQIENHKTLVIEGFINFCLPEYLAEIRFAVELASEELKSEKEYNEFVKLLRYFVETQMPRVLEVNLIITDKGRFYLWDENGIKIEDKYINYYLDDILQNEISLDDVLISILVTIAPRKIILHNTNELSCNEPVKMIKNVFQERIIACPGCKFCRHDENHLVPGT